MGIIKQLSVTCSENFAHLKNGWGSNKSFLKDLDVNTWKWKLTHGSLISYSYFGVKHSTKNLPWQCMHHAQAQGGDHGWMNPLGGPRAKLYSAPQLCQ